MSSVFLSTVMMSSCSILRLCEVWSFLMVSPLKVNLSSKGLIPDLFLKALINLLKRVFGFRRKWRGGVLPLIITAWIFKSPSSSEEIIFFLLPFQFGYEELCLLSIIVSVFVQDMNVVVGFHFKTSRSINAFDFWFLEEETEAWQGLATSLTEHQHWFYEERIFLDSKVDHTLQRHKFRKHTINRKCSKTTYSLYVEEIYRIVLNIESFLRKHE